MAGKFSVFNKPTMRYSCSHALSFYLFLTLNDCTCFKLPTGNCDVYSKPCDFCDPCRMCVLARDPMCAWSVEDKVSEEACFLIILLFFDSLTNLTLLARKV